MLALLVVLASFTLARSCPSTCKSLQLADGRDSCECNLDVGSVCVKGIMHESVEILCLGDLKVLNCTDIPQIPFSRNGSLAKFIVSDCGLDGALRCWLDRVGASTAGMLVLKDVSTSLEPVHVEGLDGVRSLLMYYAGAQYTLPIAALAALPNLKEVRIRGANFSSPLPLADLPLTYLELSGGIQELADGAFQLGQLERLQLFVNKIGGIREGNFKGLQSLKDLNLDKNKIRRFPPKVFSQMPRLVELSFVDNAVEEVDNEAFYGLKELKKIKAFNNAAPMTLGPRSFSNLPSLQELQLNNCKISSLPPDLFFNSTQLKTLSIKGNKIKELPRDLFRDQQLLTIVDLSGNRIEKLADGVFWPLGSLLELNLDGNLIEILPGDIFKDLAHLQKLNINNNRLAYIADTAISHTRSLKHISLSNNNLTLNTGYQAGQYIETTQSPFRTLYDSLEYLDLSGNKITQIYDDWKFVLYQHIKVLNLSRNGITDLFDADTQFLCNECVIDLQYNNISRVILKNLIWYSKDELTTDTLESKILLDNNPFVCDCINENFILKLHNKLPYFNVIPKLDIGEATCTEPSILKGELLKNIDPSILTCPLKDNCPEGCTCDIRPSTKHIELTCDVTPDSLPDPSVYSSFNINSTMLTLKSKPSNLDLPRHVDMLILRDLHLTEMMPIPDTVIYVDIANNDLVDIPTDILRRNVTMLISGNPFLCDCSHDGDVQILQSYKNNVVDKDLVKCSDRQSPWLIDAPRLCSVQRAVTLGSSLAILSIILIIIAGLFYKYSLQIKIYIYSCEKLRWLIAEDDIDKDKTYDAFVSFSHKDEKFVAEKLVPVLESGSRPFKLCLHYRDWIGGEWIPAQIANSVEQSRRTIIVLSKSFVESVWGTMEFRVAHKKAQKEKRTRIVVILLEDAPLQGDLDAELRAYLSTNTYIKWGDPWFWEKLRYALAGERDKSKPKQKKAARGGLNVRLNSNGQLVNETKDTMSTELSIG